MAWDGGSEGVGGEPGSVVRRLPATLLPSSAPSPLGPSGTLTVRGLHSDEGLPPQGSLHPEAGAS